ncbi:hypothetical protein EY643_13860 [Halioglobus maricola]|uniref:Uncharacterized protein n=1 Tax=Halioglobus maricola TaxID=2601894 RepID=A0A5P9NLF2_9GAMM|nr:hypothetical protein [Halioglobus maricola]QFU76651.1 hypothetical protein EY643_13860 [Halioglobus maricola]
MNRKEQYSIMRGAGSVLVKMGPCPMCHKLIFVDEEDCPHCGYALTEEERQHMIKRIEKNNRYSMAFGALFFGSLFGAVVYFIV